MIERRRFRWALTLVVIPALCLLMGLGVWQVQRLQWKQRLIADAEVAASLPRVTLLTAMRDPGRLEFRKVTVDCPGLSTAPFIQVRSIVEGEGGVRLWSLCRPSGFAFPWLVDRGFVADTVTVRPAVIPSEQMTQIAGEVRLLPLPSRLTPAPDGQTFYGPDALAMAKALGSDQPAGPHMIYATSASNPDFKALRPSAPPPVFSNNHLGYAITWFGLALVLVGFYVALLRRRLRKPTS